ncbi:MAG: SPFH/Band 7/PHB domain protein [Thermoprotei archaeon]|nr:MAG: SPFH/Band 7/PHB domain protein [Thermoprotei archaeon]
MFPGIGLGFALLYAFLIIVIIAIISASIKVVPQFERVVVLRLGKIIGAKGPGIVFLIPYIDKGIRVDMRERFLEVTRQTCITKDNAPVDVDFLIYFKVIDPERSVIAVRNFETSAVGIATTTLRAVIGDIDLDEVLAKREYINKVLRSKLDEVTERWGVKVTAVEIREIIPPKDVQEAMIRQISAERSRRAMILEAEGKRESLIKVAEGEKQAAILKAEGERTAAMLRAEGIARSLATINETATKLDTKTMLLQYLEAWKDIASSSSTKLVFPVEVFNFFRPFVDALRGEERRKS